MQKRFIWLAAAAMAVGTTGAMAQDQNRNAAERAGQKADNAADRTGDRMENAADRVGDAAERTGDRISNRLAGGDVENVKGTLETSTEAALSKDGFDDLVERFVDADRNRIGQNMPSEEQVRTLNNKIEQIQKAWKDKYGQEFAINDRLAVFDNRYAVHTGEIGDRARLAGERMPATPDTGAVHKDAPGADTTRTDPAHKDANKDATRADPARSDAARTDSDRENVTLPGMDGQNRDADRNREPGRNIASATIPASHGLPQLQVSFVHEFPNVWKIDIPDTVDGQKLYDNLVKHLTMVGDKSGEWPADVNDAYRFVNHHVMLALHDKEMHEGQDKMDGQKMDGQKMSPPAPMPAGGDGM